MICGFIENLPFNACSIFCVTRKIFLTREIFQVVLKTENVTRAENLMLGVALGRTYNLRQFCFRTSETKVPSLLVLDFRKDLFSE